MKVIPAIDIYGGKCAQLVGGKPGTEKFYGDPVTIAKNWRYLGAEILHVIDLDATFGDADNLKTVWEIKRQTGAKVHFGGGIRDYEKAQTALRMGMDRVILGTLAINDYKNNFIIIRKLEKEFGLNRVIIALDSKQDTIVVKGWQEKTEFKTTELMKELEDRCWGFLYTNVDVEGRMQGINKARIAKVVSSTTKPVIVAGGISTEQDLEDTKEAEAWGAIVGKALYEGKIQFKNEI